MKTWIQPVQLNSDIVQLEPLHKEHAQALVDAATDGQLWNLWYTSVPSTDTISKYIETALSQAAVHQALPFVIRHVPTNQIIGSTRYCNIETEHRRLEIGYTWYAKSYQRTAVNTNCKLLLLQHAFESLQCIAVEFRTHWYNHASRNAILRLGAKQDGVLRNHKIDKDGNLRDTVVFSILSGEWPTVKKSLIHKMNRHPDQ